MLAAWPASQRRTVWSGGWRSSRQLPGALRPARWRLLLPFLRGLTGRPGTPPPRRSAAGNFSKRNFPARPRRAPPLVTPPAGTSHQLARQPRAAPRCRNRAHRDHPAPTLPPQRSLPAAAQPPPPGTSSRAFRRRSRSAGFLLFRWLFSFSEDKGNKEVTSPAVIIRQQIEQEDSEHCREDNPSTRR